MGNHGDSDGADDVRGRGGADPQFLDSSVTVSGVGMPEPKSIDTCRIEARLSSTGSRMYRAVDLSLGKTVVVKLMKPPEDEDPAAVERFLAFGQALVGLGNPHVVSVLRAGRDGPTPFIVLDYVAGEDLELVLKRERTLLPQAALRAVLDAASGLDAALQRGVLHGDVRPRHLLRVRGEVKLTSFGLTPRLRTHQGRVLLGHPAYLAPEVIQRQDQAPPPDHRADIYALGCTLFELLAGRPPYGTASADALLASHMHEPFPTLRSQAPRVPVELEELLERMVAKDPARRFGSYVELLQHGAALLPRLRHLQPLVPALVVEEGRQPSLRVDVPEGELLLGRTPGEGLVIDDARVSRRHAMVRRTGDYLEIEDLGSRNGIRVNGVEVRHRALHPGDRVEVGDTTLRLEGPPSAVPQVPAVPGSPAAASPLRGAFGDVETAHPPALQAQPDALGDPTAPDGGQRLQVLARLSALLAARSVVSPDADKAVWREALSIVAEVLGADHHIVVAVQDGQPVFEASSAHEAQLLSGTLPALERSLPGQLSLSTTVRVNVDDRWAVVLTPVLAREQTGAVLVLVKRIGRFSTSALTILEATAALLGLRGSGR